MCESQLNTGGGTESWVMHPYEIMCHVSEVAFLSYIKSEKKKDTTICNLDMKD